MHRLLHELHRLDDLFIGGRAGVPAELFIQKSDGSFVASAAGQPWAADKAYEVWGSLFFDAVAPGSSMIQVSGIATAPDGAPIQIQFSPVTVTVR